MGIDSKSLPENLRRCIPKEERQKDAALQTSEEIADKQAMENEREMHDCFERWCKVNDLDFVHSRMDRKSTIEAGWPDFTILRGIQYAAKACCVEFKHGDNVLQPIQTEVIARLQTRGIPVLVTNNVAQAIHWTRKELGVE